MGQCVYEFFVCDPPLTSSSSLPGASGPTTPESIKASPADNIPVPVKNQRPFTSGPKGYTVWYISTSTQPLSSPPSSLPATAGVLYIHVDLSKNTKQVWLCDIGCNWTDITTMETVKHPSIADRILLLRSDGIPSWLTSTGYGAIQSRRNKHQR